MGGRVVVAEVVDLAADDRRDAAAVVVLASRGRLLVRPKTYLIHAREYPEEHFGAALARDRRGALDVTVLADVDQRYDQPWLDVADVVLGRAEYLPCPPREWIGRVFARFPGAAIVAVGGDTEGSVLGLRDGTLMVVGAVGAGPLLPAFLHGWVAGGSPVTTLDDGILGVGQSPDDPQSTTQLFRVRIDRWQTVE